MPCGGAAAIAASDPTLEAKLIPNWVKNNAGWWATDQIEDTDFYQRNTVFDTKNYSWFR